MKLNVIRGEGTPAGFNAEVEWRQEYIKVANTHSKKEIRGYVRARMADSLTRMTQAMADGASQGEIEGMARYLAMCTAWLRMV
jgi:hypothetical protein